MRTAHEEQYKGLTIKLVYDQDCESPLEYDEGVFITYRKDSRYILGNAPIDRDEFESIGARIKAGELVGLPVFAYIHSGVALNTSGFSCPWDSGQSGFIYITKATALAWQGGEVLTAKRRARALDSLQSVVKMYSQWLGGECYGYIIEDSEGEELSSCWGFIGQEYALEEAKREADYHAKEAEKARHWGGDSCQIELLPA